MAGGASFAQVSPDVKGPLPLPPQWVSGFN